jgi:hypothetical protein
VAGWRESRERGSKSALTVIILRQIRYFCACGRYSCVLLDATTAHTRLIAHPLNSILLVRLRNSFSAYISRTCKLASSLSARKTGPSETTTAVIILRRHTRQSHIGNGVRQLQRRIAALGVVDSRMDLRASPWRNSIQQASSTRLHLLTQSLLACYPSSALALSIFW